jgi:DNA transposition AAA+ family ATPase
MNGLKENIKACGKTYSDFAREMGMKISICSLYLNGYVKATDEFQFKRIAVFKKWENQDAPQKSAEAVGNSI